MTFLGSLSSFPFSHSPKFGWFESRESGDPKDRNFAITQIIILVLARRARNGHPIVSQYFGFQGQERGQRPSQSIDELILAKHSERELEP